MLAVLRWHVYHQRHVDCHPGPGSRMVSRPYSLANGMILCFSMTKGVFLWTWIPPYSKQSTNISPRPRFLVRKIRCHDKYDAFCLYLEFYAVLGNKKVGFFVVVWTIAPIPKIPLCRALFILHQPRARSARRSICKHGG